MATFNPTNGDSGLEYIDPTFSTARDATDAENGAVYIGVSRYTNQYDFVRGFVPFDTSSIPDGATITSATLQMYVNSKDDACNDAYSYISVVQSTQASSSSLANADYDQLGTTKGSDDIDYTGVTTGAYNTWTLNATGLTWISKTGITYLGLKDGHDIENNIGSLSGANMYSALNFQWHADANPPILTVNYTLPAPVSSNTIKMQTVKRASYF